MKGVRVLVVDDEQGVRSTLSAVLRDEGFEVETAESGEACLAILEERSFQAILLDVWLPGRDGLETLKSIRRTGVDSAVIMISGHGTIETAVRATRLGAHDFVEKPLSLEKIVLTLHNALRARKLEERNRLLREELRRETELIGESDPIRRLREALESAAPTGAGILLTGENGVGKELAARFVHSRSPRAEEAFIEMACPAIPSDLALTELFGRVSGPEGGSAKGKLELAQEGTLFLDGAWALPDEAQHRLMRAMETGRFLPVGGHVAMTCDVRLIAASERDLAVEVAAGRFREDLRLVLNVVSQSVPPLRERRIDLPLLVEHYLERYAREYGRPAKSVDPAAMEALSRYAWPGNVRELRNVVERLVILTPGEVISLSGLPPNLTEAALPAEPPADRTLKAARRAFEKGLIVRRLEETSWNVTRAAESLGVERSNLYRKMKAYAIRAGPEHAE